MCEDHDDDLPEVDMTTRRYRCRCGSSWEVGSDWPLIAADRGNPSEPPDECPDCGGKGVRIGT